MSKNKNQIDLQNSIETVASHIGLTVMSMAIIAGMAEFAHNKEGQRAVAVLQPQPVYVSAGPQPIAEAAHHTETSSHESEFRRGGKEEIRHTSASYGTFMRSHPVAGTV